MKKKIEINIILLCSLIIGAWAIGYFNQYYREPVIKEVEVIKEVVITDTIYVDKIVEEKIYIPKYITQIERDTIEVEVPIEVIVEKRIPITKEVYVDKIVDRTIEVTVNESKMFVGFGYQYDFQNYFSGANIKLIHKTPKDKMFSLDVGFRNDLLDFETGVGKLRPYIGGSIYFRLDNPNKQ